MRLCGAACCTCPASARMSVMYYDGRSYELKSFIKASQCLPVFLVPAPNGFKRALNVAPLRWVCLRVRERNGL